MMLHGFVPQRPPAFQPSGLLARVVSGRRLVAMGVHPTSAQVVTSRHCPAAALATSQPLTKVVMVNRWTLMKPLPPPLQAPEVFGTEYCTGHLRIEVFRAGCLEAVSESSTSILARREEGFGNFD
jgi:hypothetical protein